MSGKKEKPENLYDKMLQDMLSGEPSILYLQSHIDGKAKTLTHVQALIEIMGSVREATKRLSPNTKNRDLKESAQFLLNKIGGIQNGLDQAENYEYLKNEMLKFQERWDSMVDSLSPLIVDQKEHDKKTKGVLQQLNGMSLQEQIDLVWGTKKEYEKDKSDKQKDIELEATRKSIALIERVSKQEVNWLAKNTKGIINAGVLIVVDTKNWVSDKVMYQMRKSGLVVERVMYGTYILIPNAKIVGVPIKKKKALNEDIVVLKRMQEVLDVKNQLRLISREVRRRHGHFYGVVMPVSIDLNVGSWMPVNNGGES